MTRRSFLRTTGSLALASWASGAAQQKRPNIIFLLTDDQRWDTLGVAGNRLIHTPQMDRLATEGVRFRNAFVTTSICVSSRASIFLGQYERRHQVADFAQDFTPQQLRSTYPLLLRRHGYRTGFIGKYGVGRNLPQEQFDYWKGIPGQPRYETTDEDGNAIHSTRLFGRQAIEFLRGSPSEQPFCLSISFKAPHVQDGDPRQFIPDPAYDDLYRDVTIPATVPQASDLDPAMPEFMRSEAAMTRKRWHLRFENDALYQEMVKNYYRLISGVDEVIGKIRRELARRGLADNTIIALMGDNGFYLGERGWAGKWYGHEFSIRVPLIVYDPRLPESRRGRTRDEMALNIDIAPTLLDLAGVPAAEEMQGRSLVPLLQGKTVTWRSDFLYEHTFHVPPQHREAAGYIPASVGVRTSRYKYLRYFEQTPVYEELYDLQHDPLEQHNLASSVEHATLLDQLRKRCDALIEESK
jgi:arylsulfatase A-like enzyme